MKRFNTKANIILKGDCIKQMKKLREKSVDLIITDPPYNLGFDYGKYKDKRENYYSWCFKWIKECERILKDNGSIYIINYPEINARILVEMRKLNLIFRNWIVWHYPSNIGHSKTNWTRSQRSILFYSKGNKFKFNLKEGEVVEDFLKFNLVKNTSKEKVKGSKNQIPEKLVELLIEISSNKGDLVFDPFIGYGTIAKACINTKRKFLGIEIDKDNIKIAKRRINETRKNIKKS